MEQIAFPGIGENLLPEFASVFEAPEEIPVVVGAFFGFRDLISGIGDDLRKRLLELIPAQKEAMPPLTKLLRQY